MLKRKELLEGIDEEYHDMLKQVDIANFTKCVAAFAGLPIKEIPDNIIKTYLHTWAKNKYRFFKMLGHKLYIDKEISYENPNKQHVREDFEILAKDYIHLAPWILGFKEQPCNKIESHWVIDPSIRIAIEDLFPGFEIIGTTVTHFFSRYLNAPEELITAIGKIYEGDIIQGKWTISIDPTDMMLASENPYKWQSCYRLTVPNGSSHADGCLASVLDTSTVISYIWTKEGEYVINNTADNYLIKDIRYKRIRQWISISPNMTCIHFNRLYPTNDAVYGKEFSKELRSYVEQLVATYNNMPDNWKLNSRVAELKNKARVDRKYLYGYNEFIQEIYINECASRGEKWKVYNESIVSPDGSGHELLGSDASWVEYTGEGFISDNFFEIVDPEYDDDEEAEQARRTILHDQNTVSIRGNTGFSFSNFLENTPITISDLATMCCCAVDRGDDS